MTAESQDGQTSGISEQATCVLLDSVKIRTMSWENLMRVDTDMFALAATAPSSESFATDGKHSPVMERATKPSTT